VRPRTSPALDDDRRSEDGEGRGGAKPNNSNGQVAHALLIDMKLDDLG